MLNQIYTCAVCAYISSPEKFEKERRREGEVCVYVFLSALEESENFPPSPLSPVHVFSAFYLELVTKLLSFFVSGEVFHFR